MIDLKLSITDFEEYKCGNTFTLCVDGVPLAHVDTSPAPAGFLILALTEETIRPLNDFFRQFDAALPDGDIDDYIQPLIDAEVAELARIRAISAARRSRARQAACGAAGRRRY